LPEGFDAGLDNPQFIIVEHYNEQYLGDPLQTHPINDPDIQPAQPQ